MQKQAKTNDKTDIHDTIVKVMKNKEYKFWLYLGVRTCETHEWRKTKKTKKST